MVIETISDRQGGGLGKPGKGLLALPADMPDPAVCCVAEHIMRRQTQQIRVENHTVSLYSAASWSVEIPAKKERKKKFKLQKFSRRGFASLTQCRPTGMTYGRFSESSEDSR
jgi:hypothetical protein